MSVARWTRYETSSGLSKFCSPTTSPVFNSPVHLPLPSKEQGFNTSDTSSAPILYLVMLLSFSFKRNKF